MTSELKKLIDKMDEIISESTILNETTYVVYYGYPGSRLSNRGSTHGDLKSAEESKQSFIRRGYDAEIEIE